MSAIEQGDSGKQQSEQLIKSFYTSFQQGSWRGMLDCYHEDVFFYDPVFQNLDSRQVRAMWEMLLSRAKEMSVEFNSIHAEDGYGSCNWVATYTFSATGRKVVNRVTAHFKFSEGKIVEHQDDFDLWKWSAQALGFPGLLLGWSSFMKNKIRRNARGSLEKFMARTAPEQS